MPSSLLGKAPLYMRGQWPKLVRYIENGNWPISNHLCENAIRPFVVGRQGWLFADSVAGAHASANLDSIVESCKANGIDPYRYLRWLFEMLPKATNVGEYAALLPWRLPGTPRAG
ncbi:IS66 C-terminal element [Paraburkholderia lycopersici]|uniref:IS66 C-terminal element n=1 Tax=Paraburkholderia lycopersici TaxID=416944 RepID=A0A1G6W897_9BURK|nr:IS66 C-terminal element [Paraburkholderia lycopersici]